MISDDTIAQLKNSKEALGKKLHIVEVEMSEDVTHELVVVQPSKAKMKMFFHDLTKDGADAFKVVEFFVMDAIIHPTKQEITKLFEEAPMLITKISVELQKLVGTEKAVRTKEIK